MLKEAISRLVWLALLLNAGLVMAAPHKVRVSDPADVQSLLAHGGRLVADYGSFQIIETDDAALASLGRNRAQIADEQDSIQLHARPLNTRAAQVQALRRPITAFAGKRLHLVQFAGPVKPEWHDLLEKSGAKVIAYIPHNAYLVYGDVAALSQMQARVRSGNILQWEGEYAGDFKIHPNAIFKGSQPSTGGLFAIQLVDDPAANELTLALIDQLRLGPIQRQSRALNYLNVIVRLPADRLADIAAQPEVVSIQRYIDRAKLDERQDQIVAGNITNYGPTGPGYLSWLAGKGFTQAQFTNSGFIVDVTDSGIDNGTTTPGHFGLYASGNTSLVSRVVYNRLEGTGHGGSTLEGCDGHGTLNSHILAGYADATNGFQHVDAAGFSYGVGICPFVKLGSSVIFDPDLYTFPDFENLQSEAYQSGARISANSWGAPVFGAYDADAQAYDVLVRDAQPGGSTYGTNFNQQMVIVFAAGNGGPIDGTMYSPGSAKNVITVGAAENVRSLSLTNGGNDSLGNDGCNHPDTEADNSDDVASYSSHGPCSDGRMKPDLVAPGTHVTGGVAQSSPAPSPAGVGSAIACYNAAGICALTGTHTAGSTNDFFPLGQQFYTVSSGTSHAVPAVAGASALLRQFFINRSLAPPSPAMTKAFLMNSARYLTGFGANDSLWSTSQGMGELNLGMALDNAPRVLRDQATAEKFTATGQTRRYIGTIPDPLKPFRVTLAWTDAPGNTAGNAYNNDLDLTVTVNGDIYRGNVFSGQSSIVGGAADGQNNVESVFLPAGTGSNFIVTVTAANINSDGVPGELPALDQDYALVIYNASSAVIGITGFQVSATNCFATNGIINPNDSVSLSLALTNLGNSTASNLIVTLLATNGVVAPSGAQTYGLLAPGGGAVTQVFAFTATGPCGGSIIATFSLHDGTNDIGILSQALNLGLVNLSTTVFSNASGISIPTQGEATPYPSDIVVTGLTGLVSKVTVTFKDLNHTFPDDIDMLLVGPSGTNVLLMSDCGFNLEVTNVTLTFDSDVAAVLPNSGQIGSGTYKPSNYDTTSDAFVTNAPSAPYGQTLYVFNNTNPNGTWSLYGRDDDPDDSGSIAQGWQLSITTSNAQCCPPSANLALGKSVSPIATNIGGGVTFTLGVTNLGPETASNVMVTDILPAGLSFISASASQGTATNIGGSVTAGLGTLSNGAIATIIIQASGVSAGWWTNTANVSSDTFDAVSGNNTAMVAVLVNSAPMISSIPNVITNQNSVAGPIPFTIFDNESAGGSLSLSAASSNTNLAPLANIVFGGSDTNRTVTITPGTNQLGTSTILVTVSDGSLSASNSFLLTVTSNHVPVLAAIANRTTYPTLISFTNSAIDPDAPPQALTFSLDVGAPMDASINATNGVFSWSPNFAYIGTSNFITVRVTDNGLPPLSNAKSFAVLVVAPPLIQSISISNNVVIISWSSISGRTYRVQYNPDLNHANWSNLTPDVIAAGPTASKADTNNPIGQRFYRVLVP